MDALKNYRKVVQDTLADYARLKPSHGDIRLEEVFDETRDRYGLMQVGWDRGRRVRGNLAYITLRDDKVHIEYDGFERGLFNALAARGIPEDKIVLEFQAHCEYA